MPSLCRAVSLPFACLLPLAALSAQGALFLRHGDLVQATPIDFDLRAAIERLCRGPDAGELRAGLDSAVPAGTRLLALRRSEAELTLVFDPLLLDAAKAGRIEAAIEQLTKTAFATANSARIEITAVHLAVDDGVREQDLTALLAPLPAGAPPSTPRRTGTGPTPGSANATTTGALAGRRIAVSPGHGYYWHSTLGWTTQRGVIDGTVEDIHTAEICNDYLIPMLVDMGAEVVLTREHGEITALAVADNDLGAPTYVESGNWSNSIAAGYNGGGYRFVGTGPAATATANWTVPVARDGRYPVYVFFRAGSNRASDARFTIQHTGGNTTVVVDQRHDDSTWVWVGDFAFAQATGAHIVLDNQSSSGGVVIADAVRVGAGLGSIGRGTGTSNRPRWQESSRYWAQYCGAPATIYDSIAGGEDNDDDVTCRPRFAEWRTADAFVSLHTNAGGGAGTSTYIHDTAPSAGSSTLSARIHTQIIADLRAEYASTWVDRGQLTANFGEVRLLSTMPGVLVELAFHDTPGSLDLTALHDPRFRYLAGRAIARGVLRYFAPTAIFPPEPPVALRVTQDGNRGLLVAWEPTANAAQYVVEVAPDGMGFLPVATVGATSWSTGPLPFDSVLSFRVRAANPSGSSRPTEVLTAGTDHLGTAQALLVQGFDRLSRTVPFRDNTRDYLARHGSAIRRAATFSLGFDAASNEAVKLGRVLLPAYRAVVWALGEESTADESFDAAEQGLVSAYLLQGGRLFASGAEILWDLDAQGSAADRAFCHGSLGAAYAADDANTYQLAAGDSSGIFAGLPAGSFDDGSAGTYNVDFADVLSPFDAQSTVCLRYGNGLVAGLQRTVGAARVVLLGFPLETVVDPDLRARLLQRALLFLLAPLPITAPTLWPIGQRATLQVELPADAGLPYIAALSYARQPGIALPGGGLFPLQQTFLLDASIDPNNPLFGNFLGTLDAQGRAAPFLDLPFLPVLIGLPLYASGVTLQPGVGLSIQTIWNWCGATVSP